MKWLVEDCENPSAPVGNRLDAVTRSRSVFAANPFVKKAVLFGSFARGEQKDSSDVDFFLGLDPSCTSSDYLSMLDSLASALGRDVDVTVRLNGATDRFIENLKTEGVLIYFGIEARCVRRGVHATYRLLLGGFRSNAHAMIAAHTVPNASRSPQAM